jgi:tetratricopeptide (TPR) repeat protein
MTMPKGWKPSTTSSYSSKKSRIDLSNYKNSAKTREIKKALVIGVSKYDHIPPLDLCKNDAEEMYNVLQSQDYEIGEQQKLVGYVTFNNLRDTIYDFFKDKSLSPKDTLFFYFSGHGLPGENENYLASSEIEEERPDRRGLEFNTLTSWIENSNSKRIIAILDCCFSGSIRAESKSGATGQIGEDDTSIAKVAKQKMEEKMEERIKESEGVCFLASSLSYQQSLIKKDLGHSLYTYYLLEGLKGQEGFVDENGYVTVDHLSRYVYEKLITERKDLQKPVRKSNISGDLVIAYHPHLVKKIEEQSKIRDSIKYYSPNDISSLNSKGITLYNQGKYQEAIELFEKALEIDSTNVSICYNRFLARLKIQKVDIISEIKTFLKLPKLSQTDWNDLLFYISKKKVIPIIGESILESFNQINGNIFPTSKDLSIELAKEFDYPFEDFYRLPKVAQFFAIDRYPNFPKEIISSRLENITIPDFKSDKYKKSPHIILAQLDLPVYITTNYDHFMEAALESQGKKPVSEICLWNDFLIDHMERDLIPYYFSKSKDFKSNYQPTSNEPLVFHLFGSFKYPESMVLTEDDFSNFITYMKSEKDILPVFLEIKLATSLFLLIGYRFDNSLDFHSIFQGIHSIMDCIARLSSKDFAVLQVPPIEISDEKNNEKKQNYFNQILRRFGLKVCWEYSDEFLHELQIK